MGNYTIKIEGSGANSNIDHPNDIEKLTAKFIKDIEAVGHDIKVGVINFAHKVEDLVEGKTFPVGTLSTDAASPSSIGTTVVTSLPVDTTSISAATDTELPEASPSTPESIAAAAQPPQPVEEAPATPQGDSAAEVIPPAV